MLRQPRVLVVDDHHNAAESLGAALGILGCQVRVAHSGNEALTIATDFKPQLVVLDIMMPGLDGVQTANLMRREPWAAMTTFVAHSALGFQEIQQRVPQADFAHYLRKPASLAAFERIINMVAGAE